MSERSPGKVIGYPSTPVFLGFSGGSAGKESSCNAGDLGSIPGLERSPGEGTSYPLQFSGLENSVDCIVHGVAESQTRITSWFFEFWLGKFILGEYIKYTEIFHRYSRIFCPNLITTRFIISSKNIKAKKMIHLCGVSYLSILNRRFTLDRNHILQF